MLKAFMTFWSLVRRFKDIFGQGFLTLIPVVNILFTWHYAGKHASNGVVGKYYDRMTNNISKGFSAFDNNTRSYWYDVLSFSLLSFLFIAISVAVNWYTFTTWPGQFDYQWIVTYNLTVWYQVAGLAITAAIILSTIGAMLNKIYQAHVRYDPDYMPEDAKSRDPAYVQKVLEARKAMG